MGSITPDIMRTQFYPPIRHVSPKNPWLPLLTPHQLVEINSAFKNFDRDGDGHIEVPELRRVMSELGISVSTEEVKRLIASVDTDGNGRIEFDEFVGIMAERMLREEGDPEIEQALAFFDQSNSGYVSVDFIRKTFQDMGGVRLEAAEVDAMIAMLQPDAEGRVASSAFRSLPCWDNQAAKDAAMQTRRGISPRKQGDGDAEPALSIAGLVPPPVRSWAHEAPQPSPSREF